MFLASVQVSSYRYRPSPGGRVTAIALSLAVIALIVFIMIRMGALTQGGGEAGERLTAVRMSPQSSAAKTRRRTAVARAEHAPSPQRQPTPRPKVAPRQVPPPKLLNMSKAEFAASDISKLPKHSADASGDTTAGQNSAAAYGPGAGPGGAHLYIAEWYREPTHAELVTYLPQRSTAGDWAVIACRTVERFHVDDCRELDESPRGSGLARALRRAAWQFLVRPPRLDGHPIIGAWVRIRFDFTHVVSGDVSAESDRNDTEN